MPEFLLTALGHSFQESGGAAAAVAGLDFQRPNGFVPVVGVIYLCGPVTHQEVLDSCDLGLETAPNETEGGAELKRALVGTLQPTVR